MTKWGHSQVKVCFANSNEDVIGKVQENRLKKVKLLPFKELEKDIIVRTIENEYTKERTGIHFVGWEDCDKSSSSDAIISKAKSIRLLTFNIVGPTYAGDSSIGEDGDVDGRLTKKTGKTPFIAFTDFSPVTIAHEFGHLAGLRHEHIHTEAAKDQKCLSLFQQSTASYNQFISRRVDRYMDYTKNVTEYDKDSIMNYCAILNLKTRKELLSPLDQKTLKSEYEN